MRGKRVRGYLFSHLVKIGVGSVVHHRVGEHQIDIPLILVGVGHPAVPYFRFYRLQVSGSSDDVVIIRCVRNLYWAMKNASVSELAYLVVKERYNGLKSAGGYPRGGSTSFLGRRWGKGRCR